jgi:acyl transferase domain-containing protein/phosphopantetheinyl transferase
MPPRRAAPAAAEPPMPIAIIGMACLFPQAGDLRSFWNNVLGKVDAVGEPPPKWDAERYLAQGRIRTASGGYLNDLYRFDPRPFGIMPNSIDGGEPDHFLALRIAQDALADAGYAGRDVDHAETGIVLGHSTYLHRGQVTVIQNNIVLDQTLALLRAALPHLDDAQVAALRERLRAKLPPTNADTAPGLVPNVMTGRIANRLNLRGPNYLVDAACSSSLLAVAAAMDELRTGRSRLMLAGGVNASLPADVTAIFTQLGALSARGKVRPFEEGSDGTLLGEGLGVVVLKRLDDALADGDRIHAVLRGIGQASDGRVTGLLAPSAEGEALSIRRAYAGCGIEPGGVGLVECHGTGIPLGDRTEIAALGSVFGGRAEGAGGSVAIGSVKSMISHCIPAAGIAGLIKTALALSHRVLPPTLCERVNPALGLEATPFYVNTEARPWFARPGVVRRAGVDSFGFGGINTHAIVEEAPAHARRAARLEDWPFELFVWSADDAAGLLATLDAAAEAIGRHPQARLSELAAGFARRDRAAPHRAALVAKDRTTLAKGITTLAGRLRAGDAGERFSTRAGASYSATRLEGGLAFLFPGEGSQYLGMLADLALHFDEVRGWLDFWHGLYDDAPGATRTDFAFPPASELTPERRRGLEARLHQMDVGSEAVMVGGQAMFSLLTAFGVEADAMLGHSSGESAALAASGALPAASGERLAEFIRQLNEVYRRVLAEGKIPVGALLAVGALPAPMVHAELAKLGATTPHRLHVAMDNCANQLVLYGSREAVAAAESALVAAGGICMHLPFDRGYHTPDFEQVREAFHAYYEAIGVRRPSVPLYSCATAERFPADPAAVRELAARQWSHTVRFREAVLRMHQDGIRCFVEVGPSANLTAFLGDILDDRPHVALATNQRRRHGLEQWLVTLAQLYVLRPAPKLARLFEGREIPSIDLDAPAAAIPPMALIDNTLPVLRLTEADTAFLRALAAPTPGAAPAADPPPADAAPAPEAAHEAMGDPRAASAAMNEPFAASAAMNEPFAASAAMGDPRAASAAMSGHFDLMQSFLAHQQAVAIALADGSAAAQGAPEPEAANADEAAPTDATPPTPFLDEIVTATHQALHARCALSLHRDAFLRDHVLSGPVAPADARQQPTAHGLSCVPLMVSLEVLAEAAAALLGRGDVAVIEDVRATDWIALDAEALVLDVHAERLEGSSARVRIEVQGERALAATVRFGAPPPPGAALPPLVAAKRPRWDGAGIYEAGMFHGPLFQSLAGIRGWTPAGIDAVLAPMTLQGFFVPGESVPTLLNPVLLDAAGQLAACWVAEHVGTDFNCFPAAIERIEFGVRCPQGSGLEMQARQQPVDPARAADIAALRRWDIDALAPGAGAPLVRIRGLTNVYFPVPHDFYLTRRRPLEGRLGRPLADPRAPEVLLWRLPMLDDAFCAQSGGIFLRILAQALLTPAERLAFHALPRSPRQRRQWLLGRACLKEAVRAWIEATTGTALYATEIEVHHDEHGAPFVDGDWCRWLCPAPAVSLTHDDRACLAAVAEEAVGVDAEALARVRDPALLGGALGTAEAAWIATLPTAARAAALVRTWVAKEAAAKALGTGLRGEPAAFEVRFTEATLGHALVRCNNLTTEVFLAEEDGTVRALSLMQRTPITDPA